MALLRRLLQHPLTGDADLDDSDTTLLRRTIIRRKAFLRKCYETWYDAIVARLPAPAGRVLEIGSGAGFLHERIPSLITSEIFHLPDLSIVADAHYLPFADRALDAIVMVDVLHHLPAVRSFFASAAACVRPGGRVVMVEPWATPWSRIIYRHLHHEPFEPDAVDWHFASTGPLSGANGAMPWIIFQRDREVFGRDFPQWRVIKIKPIMPLCYLVSGGVSMRTFMPGFTYPVWRAIEHLLPVHWWAMFAVITLERQGSV